MTQLNSQGWVAEQYRTPANLQARIRLHERFGTNPYRWQHWVFDHIIAPPKARVVEIGCGPGTLWIENRHRIPADWRLHLTDQSPGMVRQAAVKLAAVRNIAFGVADAQTLPIADQSVDVVIANHMLYHVPDRGRALAEIERVLRPGGRFYAATNGKNHMAKLRELAQRFAPQSASPVDLHERFTFEQGHEEIGRLFETVTLHPYENRLIVTDADALADYMLSGTPVMVPEEAQTLLRRWLPMEMAKTGSIEIANETGLFEAVKAERAKAEAEEAEVAEKAEKPEAPPAKQPPVKRPPAKRRTGRSRKDPPSDNE